ncbi:MAG: MFS transporter [Planctomycetia bacterium]|nr:MFS transporter [Planctomycetia bacterium]
MSEEKDSFLPYRWELLILLWFAFLFNQADRAMFGFVMPLIKTDLQLTDVQLGLVASTFHLFYGILAPFAGYVGDIFRRSRIVVLSIFTWSLATLLTGLSSHIVHLILFRGASLSLGEAFYLPSANALICQFHEKTRAFAMSIHQTALYCGMIGSGILAGWLGMRYGWRAPFLLFGILGILWAGVLFFRLKDAVSENRSEKSLVTHKIPVSEVLSYLFHHPCIWLMALIFGCLVFINVGYITWMPTLLHEHFQLSLASAGFSSMFYHVLGALGGVLLGGKISDWAVRRRADGRLILAATGFLCAAPFLFMLGKSATLLGTLVGVGGFGFFRGICDSTFFPLLLDGVENRYRSSIQGFVISFGLLIGALAPIALGIMKTSIGLPWGMALMAGVSLAGVFFLGIARCFFPPSQEIDR